MNFKLYSAAYAEVARCILNLRTLYIWYVLLKLNWLKPQFQWLLKPCVYVRVAQTFRIRFGCFWNKAKLQCYICCK